MQSIMRQVHAAVAWLLVGSIVVQVWLAGMAIPQLGGNGSFATHRDVGYLIGLVALVLFLTALLRGLGRRADPPEPRDPRPVHRPVVAAVHGRRTPIEALHPVNAAVMFVVSLVYARAVWRERATGSRAELDARTLERREQMDLTPVYRAGSSSCTCSRRSCSPPAMACRCFVAFQVRRERDRARMAALLDLRRSPWSSPRSP